MKSAYSGGGEAVNCHPSMQGEARGAIRSDALLSGSIGVRVT